MKLNKEEFLNAFFMAVENTVNGEENEVVDTGKYINKSAAVLLNKFAGVPLESLTFENGVPLEMAYIDDLRTALGNFNRSEYITGQKAKIFIDAVINQSEFFNNFTVVYGDELVIPVDLTAYSKRQLTSTERLGRQLTASEKSALASISGFEMLCLPIELQFDISMTTIRNNLYDPQFEKKVLIDPMTAILAEDLLDLATNGTSDAYSTVSSDGFLALGIGHEYLLKNLNGTWTNSNGTTIVTGKFGVYHTPVKLSIDFTVTSYDGFDLIALMDKAYMHLPSKYRDRKDLAYVMSQHDADLYSFAKGNAKDGSLVVNNESRDRITNQGIIVPHRGIPIKVNPKKASIADGGNFYLGALKELYVGTQKKIETTREYKARMSVGGSGIENTKILPVDFQVGLRNAFVMCAPSMAVEDLVMIKSVVSGTTVYSDRSDNKGDAYTSAETDQALTSAVTVYCDTPGARIFKHVNAAAFDDGTDLPVDALPTIAGDVTEISSGDLVTLTTGQYATFRAYLADNSGLLSTPSSLAKIRYTAA